MSVHTEIQTGRGPRYLRALRKRLYALVEAAQMTASDASVILTCSDKRFGRLLRGMQVQKIPHVVNA